MSKNLYICGYVPSAEIRHMSKETQVYDKRDLCICPKPYIFVNTCCPLHMSKETYVYVKRDLCICQKRPMYISKETYVCMNRRPICVFAGAALCRDTTHLSKETHVYVKETCVYVKRDLYECLQVLPSAEIRHTCQKRPMYTSKETYVYVKRDLCICVHVKPSAETRLACLSLSLARPLSFSLSLSLSLSPSLSRYSLREC